MNAKNWNLLDDGLLWIQAMEGAADPEFRKQAREFVTQLQQAVKPKNALEGVLLDRMASSYLRKVLLLQAESGLKKYRRAGLHINPQGKTPEQQKQGMIGFSLATDYLEFGVMLKYESMLDQGFHRDAFLLQQLQDESEQKAALPPKKAAKSNGKTLEAEGETSVG